MAALGLNEGEWLHASKPALKAVMRPTFELKARVWFCGILHTQSYQSESAMTKFRGKIIPLSPVAVARELRDEALEFYAAAGKVLTRAQEKVLNVSRQHVRRVLVELEREGLAERRMADGTPLRDLSPDQLKRLQIGKIRLYFFVRPLPSKTVPDVATNGYITFAFLSPSESRTFSKLLQRFELDPNPYVAGEGYLQETVKVAIAGYADTRAVALQDYRKAEDVAAQTLKNALDVAISSERIVRNSVSNPTVRGEVPFPGSETPPVSDAPVKEGAPQGVPVFLSDQTSSSAFSAPIAEELTTTTTTVAAAPLDEVVVVVSKVEECGGTISKRAAAKLLTECRTETPNCTIEEVTAAMDKIATTFDAQTRNPTGVFVTDLPSLVATRHEAWVRDQQAATKAQQAEAEREIRALQEMAADENEPEDVREIARSRLARSGVGAVPT